MLLAALAMMVLFVGLTQTLAEFAVALPGAGGFDAYVGRALGPTFACLTGVSVAMALAVLAWLGSGGWPFKLAILALVLSRQLRGAQEAVSLTVLVGIAALAILIAF